MVRDARVAGMDLRWRPGSSKSGKSGERFQFYSTAKTFAQFDAMAKEFYLSGITGAWRPKAVRNELVFDATREVVSFHDADTPPVPGPAVAADAVGADGDAEYGDSPEDDTDDDGDSGDDTDHGDGASNDGAEASECSLDAESVAIPDPPAPSRRSSPVRFGRHLGRRPALRAATAFVRKGLTADEATLLEDGPKTRSTYVDVPDVLMMAAKIRHEEMWVQENLRQAMESPTPDVDRRPSCGNAASKLAMSLFR